MQRTKVDFPEPDAFARRLESAGFSNVGYEVLTALGGRYHRIYRDAAGTNHPA